MKVLSCLALGLCAILVHADVDVKFSEAWSIQGKILKKDTQNSGMLSYWNQQDKEHKPLEDAKLSIENGVLKIDSSACKADKDGRYGYFILSLGASSKAADPSSYSNRLMKTAVEIKSDRPVHLELSPMYEAEKKTAFIRGVDKLSETDWKNLDYEFKLPKGISSEPVFRLTFTEPCVLWIKTASLNPVEHKKTQTISGNQILNGGAEREFYGVSASRFKELYNNSFRDYLGNIHTKDMQVCLDDKEAASGKFSFRLEGRLEDQKNRPFVSYFLFNPVKFTLGARSVINFKAKAQKNGSTLMLKLALCPSLGYIKTFRLSSEWKSYSFEVPDFGKDVNYYTKAPNEQLYPMFWTDSTVWLDDVCYWQGSEEIEYSDPAPVAVAGEISNTYIKLGAPLTASMHLHNNSGETQKLKIDYELKDVLGNIVMTGKSIDKVLSPNQSSDEEIRIIAEKRGAQTLNVYVESEGKKIRHGFLFGVIGPESGLVKRLAIDCDPSASGEFLLPFFRDMRVGTSRSWASSNGTRSVYAQKTLHDAGIRTLLNIGYGLPYVENSFAPKDLSPWTQFLRSEILPHKDDIDVYEILNEPNIWNGYRKNPAPERLCEMTPELYVETVKIAGEIIKTVDPDAKIAGPTPCTCDVPFIERVLKAGGDKYIDIITEHPYRSNPEMPDLYKDMERLTNVLKNYGDKPHWATETGFQTEGMLNDNEMTDASRNAMFKNIRNMLSAFAGGAEVYTIFALNPWNFGYNYNLAAFGTTGRIYDIAPQPVLFAMRAIADLIGDAKPCGRIYLGYDFKCYLFDSGKERIAAIWRWNGAPGRIQSTAEGTFYDIMGNPIADKEISVGPSPVYFKTSLPVEAAKKLCASFNPDGNKVTYQTRLFINAQNSFDVAITNAGTKELNGTAEIVLDNKKQSVRIEKIYPGSDFKASFITDKPISSKIQSAELNIDLNGKKVSEKIELRALFSPHAKQKITIDGNLDDWKNIPGVTLNAEENRYSMKNAVWTSGDKSITAEFKSSWDENYFYLAVLVKKDSFNPGSRSASKIWDGDSLQVAFDPLRNALKKNMSYDDDDFEYSLGSFNGSAAVYRAIASSDKYDSLFKATGLIDKGEVQLSVNQLPGKIIYEAAFAKRAVSPFKLEAGSSARFNMIVNIHNGKERIGWLELTPGIGTLPKNPGEFMDIVLEP